MANKTVALLITPYLHEYTMAIIDGARAALEERGHNLALYSATLQEYLEPGADHLRGAFESAVAGDHDAYMVVAGVVQHRARESHLNAASLFGLLPRDKTLILEDNMPGYHCLFKNNKPGMREMMRHVLDDCGCERVGFVSGPVMSYGAREREEVYREEMKERDLPVLDRWFARGLFRGGPQDLIDEYVTRNLDLEAIVCATDQLSISVYRALEKHYLRPGIDVYVTGYDDQPCAALARPPLTTVALDPFDFGFTAGQEVSNLVEGKPRACESMSGQLVERLSCGERMRSGRTIFEDLIARKPFPSHEIAQLIFDRCVKKSLAGDDSFYLAMFEDMVIMGHELCSDFGRQIDTTQFVGPECMASFMEGARVGEFRLDMFQVALDDYLCALALHAPERMRPVLVSLMTEMDQKIEQQVSVDFHESRPLELDRTYVFARMVDEALVATDAHDLYARILRGVSDAGVSDARLCLFDEPVRGSAASFGIPETIRVVGEVCGGAVSVADGEPGAVPTSEALALPQPKECLGILVGAAIGLYQQGELLGYLVADLGRLSFAQFCPISVRVTTALRVWRRMAASQ